jgi:hypothetical protein
MEISLSSGKYSINPRRVTYIEYFIRPTPGRIYPKLDLLPAYREKYQVNPDDSSEKTEGFEHYIIIHLTDDQEISFTVEDSNEYERLKSELSKVVGG